MIYLKACLVGGAFCAIGQILIDKTKMTPARILVIYVLAGILLTGIGIYEPLVSWAGAGATVPIIGFGHLLADGVREAVASHGLLGVLMGGVRSAAVGISASVFFGYLIALIFKPGDKS